MRRLAFVLVLLLVGCPSGTSSNTNAPAAMALETEPAIYAADPSDPAVEGELEKIALDRARRVSLRFAALKRLGETRPVTASRVAERLALDGLTPEFLRKNAVQVLAALPEGTSGLERVRRSSVEMGVLVARLTKEVR